MKLYQLLIVLALAGCTETIAKEVQQDPPVPIKVRAIIIEEAVTALCKAANYAIEYHTIQTDCYRTITDPTELAWAYKAAQVGGGEVDKTQPVRMHYRYMHVGMLSSSLVAGTTFLSTVWTLRHNQQLDMETIVDTEETKLAYKQFFASLVSE